MSTPTNPRREQPSTYVMQNRFHTDDDELKRLRVLNSLTGRNYITVNFRDCRLPAARLSEIQGVLAGCHVIQTSDNGQDGGIQIEGAR